MFLVVCIFVNTDLVLLFFLLVLAVLGVGLVHLGLGLALLDVVGVAALGVLDIGRLGVRLHVLLLVGVHADLQLLLLDLEPNKKVYIGIVVQ